MTKKQLHNKIRLLILLTLLLVVLISFAVGKYNQDLSAGIGTVTFDAKLAESMVLENEPIVKVIPGVDIENKVYVKITGKTEIPAYLYIEITDTLDTVTVDGEDVKLIDWSIDGSNWIQTNAILPKSDGMVYVYTGGTGEAMKLTNENTPGSIEVKHDIKVSQYVKSYDNTANGDTDLLTVYAYLIEVTK